MSPFPPGQLFYVRLNGKVTGPYALDLLESLRDQGMLLSVHEVSADGASWMTAAEAGLFDNPAVPPGPNPTPPPPPHAFDNLDGAPLDEEDDDPRPRRRRHPPAPRASMPAWLMLVLAGGLGLATSLGAYFLVLRPLLNRSQPEAGARTGTPSVPGERREGGGQSSDRPDPKEAPGKKPGKASFGWLRLTVEPMRPRVGEEIRVSVTPTVKGERLPYEDLSLTIAGEDAEATFDGKDAVFRLKVPDRAMERCRLFVVFRGDKNHGATTGEAIFPVLRWSRGELELTAASSSVPRGKSPVLSLRWGPKAAPPPEGTDPEFFVNGRAIPSEEVKSLGEGRYELRSVLPVGPTKVEARFARDDRYEVARATAAFTVLINKVSVRLALPEARYVPRQRARLGVTVEGERGAKLSGEVALFKRGVDQALARATLKDGVAYLDVKELDGDRIDLEARYLGDGKAHDASTVVEKGLAVIKSVYYSALAWPDRPPNETEDFTIPRTGRAGAEPLAGAGLDPKKAYHLRLVFPADEPGAESTRHTFTAPPGPGALTVSWAATYTPQLKVLKEAVPNLLRFRLEGKEGQVDLRHELDDTAVARELTFEKALYNDARFLRKDKLASIRRRLDGLRLLRAKGILEVHTEAPKDRKALPLLLIRLDGEKKK